MPDQDIIVDVPGLGVVAFPAGTSPDVMRAAIQGHAKQDSQPLSGAFGSSNLLGITRGQQRQQGTDMGQALAPWAPLAAGALAGVATGGMGAIPAMAGVGAATGAGSMLGDAMAGEDVSMGKAVGEGLAGAAGTGLARGAMAAGRALRPALRVSPSMVPGSEIGPDGIVRRIAQDGSQIMVPGPRPIMDTVKQGVKQYGPGIAKEAAKLSGLGMLMKLLQGSQ